MKEERVLIKNYRGFDITFDMESEKFKCVITEDIAKEVSSFAAVKKFIDDYKKENQGFEPFYAVSTPDSYSKAKKIKIVGIRKDRRFIYENENGSKEQLPNYVIKDFMLDLPENDALISELRVLDEQLREIEQSYRQKRKEIISKLNVVTLADFKNQLNN